MSTTDSTNNYAMAKLHAGMVGEGFCFSAIEQTAGKGQRGKNWIAGKGENITMSTVLQASAHKPFVYSATVALACYEFVKSFQIEKVSIKWPNDILIGDRKAAGILIENSLKGRSRSHSIIGTGINLNQDVFPDFQRAATSIKMATGKNHELRTESLRLHRMILARHLWQQGVSSAAIMEEYNLKLYCRGLKVKLKSGPSVFETTIVTVSDDGELVTSDTMERRFSVGQVDFIL